MKIRTTKNKFRFPRGVSIVHFPMLSPTGWKAEAMNNILRQLKKLKLDSKSFPKNTDLKFSFELCVDSDTMIYSSSQVSFEKTK